MDPFHQYQQASSQSLAQETARFTAAQQLPTPQNPAANPQFTPQNSPQKQRPKSPKRVPLADLLTDQKIMVVRDFLSKTLDSTNDMGEPDLHKIVYNGTYNMGAAAIEMAGLIMQEKLKLESLERRYRDKRARVLERIRSTRLGWAPSMSEVQVLVDGNTEINVDGNKEDNSDDKVSATELKSMVDRQQEYIDFLKAAQELIRYYPRNAKDLVSAYQFGVEIGKIIPAENEWQKYREKK
jgi:hypothetical protein